MKMLTNCAGCIFFVIGGAREVPGEVLRPPQLEVARPRRPRPLALPRRQQHPRLAAQVAAAVGASFVTSRVLFGLSSARGIRA